MHAAHVMYPLDLHPGAVGREDPALPDQPSICRSRDVDGVTDGFCWREGKFLRSGDRDGLAGGRVASLARGPVADLETAEAGQDHIVTSAGSSSDGGEHA